MPVNFNALAREGPANFYEGLVSGQQAAEQNMLAQQKRAQDQETNALNRQKAQIDMESARLGQETARLGQERTRATMTAENEDRARARRVERAGMFRERLLRAGTPEAAREIVKMQYADPELAPVLSQAGTLEQALAEVPEDPVQFQTYRQQEALGMSEWMKSQLPKVVGNAVYRPETGKFDTPPVQPKEVAPPSMVAEFNFARSPEGGGFTGSYQDFVIAREAAKRPEPVPRAPGSPVAVIGPNGQPVYVTQEQAIGLRPVRPAAAGGGGGGGGGGGAPNIKPPSGYRFTPTGDLEPIPGGPASPSLAPKDIQKREAAYPQATQSVNGFEAKSDLFIKELEKLRDDPGLEKITGPIFGRTPSVSREGSRAQSTYDKIFAKGGFQALQDMREMSKTGGALGNVSNEEGRRLEKSVVGGLDRTQNIADVKQGIDDLIAEIRGSKARVREAYDSTYEYRASRPAAAPAAPAAPTAPTGKKPLSAFEKN